MDAFLFWRVLEMTKKRIALSGGFDPIHVGHIRMIKEAANHGDVVIFLNTDNWLERKKGYIFMPFKERKEILNSIKFVSEVYAAKDEDNSVCESLFEHVPDLFGNGGDRKNDNTPEIQTCKKLGIELLWNLGGGKIQSSSDLVGRSKLRND